jgi:hypothetical protein
MKDDKFKSMLHDMFHGPEGSQRRIVVRRDHFVEGIARVTSGCAMLR